MPGPALWKLVYKLNPGAGLPGYSTLYFDGGPLGSPVSPQAASDAAGVFWKAAFGGSTGPMLPSGIIMTWPTSADAIRADNGELITSLPVTPPSAFSGSGSGAYAAGVGGCVTWRTGATLNGVRVRGRTFVVPYSQSAYDTGGTLADAHRTSVNNAATVLAGDASNLVVWHRPTTPGGTDGVAFDVSGATMTDKAAQLRSRRD